MDVKELKSGFFTARIAAALLFVVIAAGLWQGYGAWLLRGESVG